MHIATLSQPGTIVFGNHAIDRFVEDFGVSPYKNLLIVAAPEILPLIENSVKQLKKVGISVEVNTSIQKEPTVEMFSSLLLAAKKMNIDSVAGIGGGSVLDVAKLIAALLDSPQTIQDVFGIRLLSGRNIYLACMPTTAGTGSEVSPNAILLDNSAQLKKVVISPFLVPDAAYIDPLLTVTVPGPVTAATGVDALIHCIEGYANKFAHPMVDTYALKGIELIGQNLYTAVHDGGNLNARGNMALGSLYGGFCLGPVNTAAIHALAYPLGSIYQIPHGITNAVLLPHVLRFNVDVAPERYANVAHALGIEHGKSKKEIAIAGIEEIENLLVSCNLPKSLSDLDIPEDAIDTLAESAMTVTRLLKNNLRAVTYEDARQIFRNAFE